MIFATILSLVLLAAVIATVHAEQRSEQSLAASTRRLPVPGDVDDLDALVDAPLPRALLGYEPVAVRSRLVAMREAYARLAAECELASAGPGAGDARADAVADDAAAQGGAHTHGT